MAEHPFDHVYDSPEEEDAVTQSIDPTFEMLGGPEPLTIDGHRLIDVPTDDD